MKKLLLATIAIVFTASPAFAADPVEGYWLTENERAVIHITPCERAGAASMCGKIHWIIEGGLQVDKHNPDEALRTRPMCGLQILGGFDQEDVGDWEDGTIYKADDGDIYDADIEIKENGTLKVRGYLGVSLFGKTQIWNRVDPAQYPKCKA